MSPIRRSQPAHDTLPRKADRHPRTSAGVRIIRAHHLGMCFGVTRAITQATTTAEREPLTILGDLVHNERVLDTLRARGIQMRTTLAEVETATAMVTAHGASNRRLAAMQAAGLRVIDATCPLVKAAHRAIRMLVAEGRHIVIVGKAGHTEVVGMTEDLDTCDIVLTADDVDRLQPHPRIGIAAQTTQPVDRVEYLADLIRRRFPESDVALVNTVCVPTRLRQQSAEDLARESDVVLVVGGAASNNTRELVDTCRRFCGRVFHVQGPAEIQPAWVARARVIGITAGTSTPADLIDDVEDQVRHLARAAAAA